MAPPCQVSLLFGSPDNSGDTGRHSENLRYTKEAFSCKLYIDRRKAGMMLSLLAVLA